MSPTSGPVPLPGLVCLSVALGPWDGGQLANEEGAGMLCSSGCWTILIILGLLGMTWPLLALRACQGYHLVWKMFSV